MGEQGTAEPKTRNQQETEFAEWIKPEIIAEIIFEELESASIDPILENAKIVYLDILEHALYDAVRSGIDHNPAFGDNVSGFAPQPTP